MQMDAGSHRELQGDAGKCSETRGDVAGRCRETQGDVARRCRVAHGDAWREVGRLARLDPSSASLLRSRPLHSASTACLQPPPPSPLGAMGGAARSAFSPPLLTDPARLPPSALPAERASRQACLPPSAPPAKRASRKARLPPSALPAKRASRHTARAACQGRGRDCRRRSDAARPVVESRK